MYITNEWIYSKLNGLWNGDFFTQVNCREQVQNNFLSLSFLWIYSQISHPCVYPQTPNEPIQHISGGGAGWSLFCFEVLAEHRGRETVHTGPRLWIRKNFRTWNTAIVIGFLALVARLMPNTIAGLQVFLKLNTRTRNYWFMFKDIHCFDSRKSEAV